MSSKDFAAVSFEMDYLKKKKKKLRRLKTLVGSRAKTNVSDLKVTIRQQAPAVPSHKTLLYNKGYLTTPVRPFPV